MSVLKGTIHHMAKGVVTDGLKSTVTVVLGAGAAGLVFGGANIGFVGPFTFAATLAGAIARAAAAAVVNHTEKYQDAIPGNTKTWQRCGVGLAAVYALACGSGVGFLMNDFKLTTKDDTHAPQTTPTTHKFNVEADPTAECIFIVKNGQASKVSGSCTITPAAVQAPK
jgi:hypothetical protein